LTMVPQQVHLHGQWVGKRHHGCPSTGWPRHLAWYFSPFFSSPEMLVKALPFCWTPLCLQPLFCNPINGLRSLDWRTIYPCTHSDPSLLSHNLSATLNALLCSELVGCATVHTSRL
jgi:hypothetical protein